MLFGHINRPYLSNAYQAAALSVYDCAAICYEICIYEEEKAFCWFAGRDINGKQWSDHEEVWRLHTDLYWHYWNEDRFSFKLFFAKKKSKIKQKINKQATYIYTGFTKVPVYKMVLCGDVVRMFQINWRFSYFLERINHLKPFENVWNVHFHNVCTRVTFLSLFKVKV